MDGGNDHELFERAMAGDADAFTALYRNRQASLFRYALRMSGSVAIAEDIVQEVFLTLIRDCPPYDGRRGSVAAFLYGIARIHTLRRLKRRWFGNDADADEPATNDHPESDLMRDEQITSVRRAVLSLPLHYREAVVLCDLEGMEYAEAAASLGCAVGTIRSRLARARQMLARRLEIFATAQVRRGVRPEGCSI